MSERLILLTSSHAQNSATLDSLARERQELDDKEKEIRVMVEKAEEKRAWFGSFKEWVESVAAFLDEKVSYLHCSDAELNIFYFSTQCSKSLRKNISLYSENERR